jgi:hypothetical protein
MPPSKATPTPPTFLQLLEQATWRQEQHRVQRS